MRSPRPADYAATLILLLALVLLPSRTGQAGGEVGTSSVYTKTVSSPTTGTVIHYANLGTATSTTGVGAQVFFTLELVNATQVCTISGTVVVTTQNDAGTVTAVSTTFTSGSNGAISSVVPFTGFTATTTATVTGTNVLLKITPTWSAGTPTSARMTYQVRMNGQATLAPQ